VFNGKVAQEMILYIESENEENLKNYEKMIKKNKLFLKEKAEENAEEPGFLLRKLKVFINFIIF